MILLFRYKIKIYNKSWGGGGDSMIIFLFIHYYRTNGDKSPSEIKYKIISYIRRRAIKSSSIPLYPKAIKVFICFILFYLFVIFTV